MTTRKVFSALLTVLVMSLFLATNVAADSTDDPGPKPSNKWRISFSGGADSDGVIEMDITPEGGETIHTSVSIANKTSENHVAKAVVDGLKEQLPKEAFHVERDDGEDVLIKKKRAGTNFAVVVTSNTVEGVRINPKRK